MDMKIKAGQKQADKPVRRSVEEILKSEQKYCDIVNSISDGVYQLDIEGRFTFVNKVIVDRSNISEEKFYTLHYRDIVAQEDLERVQNNFLKVMRGEKVEPYELNYETGDGRTLTVEINTRPVYEDGKIIGLHGISRDVTERKQSERTLRESEERFRTLHEASFGGIGIHDKGIIFEANQGLVTMTGYELSELIGMDGLKLIAPEWRDQVMKNIISDYEKLYEAIGLRKDGSSYPLEIHGKVILYRGKKVRVTEFRDITERKRTEESLSESREELAEIFSMSLDMICIADINTATFLKVNPAFTRILGYPEQEFLKRPFLDFIHPDDVESTIAVINKKLQKGEKAVDFTNRYRCKDGTYRWLGWMSHPIPKRGITFAVAHDVTERKRAEDALRESEKKYRMVLETNPDPMIVYDMEGKVIYLNPAFTSVFGWSLEEKIGKKLDDFVPDESWPETRMMIDLVIAGKSFSGIETLRLTREGKIIPVSISGSCHRNNEGNIEVSVINLRDITGLKQAEEEKAKLEEQYRQAQKMEAIGQLAGGVAHDFNNMLNIILGYSQMALMKLESSDPLQADIREIVSAGKRSTDLVRQLLAFARKQTITPRVLDMNDTVAGMLNMLRRLIGEDIDLLWMPAANLWSVKMDPAQVDQILANLSVNARDSISGVGKITIETGNAEFDDSYCAQHPGFVPGQYVLLAVSDNGCGMDKKTLEKIFEPFFTTKETGKGTGMGLATVYGIVKQNDGFINVYSEPGKGTTFKIYLPRHGEGEVERDEQRRQSGHLTGTETVLLVEDDEALLKMAKIMLEGLGYDVLTAGKPNEAIELAEQYAEEIHLLMTDVVMPAMSGRDLQKRLSALRPDMKYLFMSGYTANVIAHRGILDEGVNFLQKPFMMNDLAARVREALDKE
jgi:PAS domain S-box-containing protein